MYFSSIKLTSLAINYFTANGPNIKRLSHQNNVVCLHSTCLIRATCSVPRNVQLKLISIMCVILNYSQYNGFFHLVFVSLSSLL